MAIGFYNEECTFKLPGKRRTAQWVRETIAAEGYTPGDINYIFCSPARHIAINREYLGHDYYTDVITFDYSDLEGAGVVSGDIFIDPQTVGLNAAEYGATQQEEMRRVLIHGVLHLCGYKDKSDEEARTMRAREECYLAKF